MLNVVNSNGKSIRDEWLLMSCGFIITVGQLGCSEGLEMDVVNIMNG